MRQATLAVLAGLALTYSAHGASFDCGKAQTWVEKLICESKELSKLDDDLAVAYTFALRFNNKTASVRQEQKQWLKERNSCTDADCLKDAYAARIQKLSLEQTTGYRMLEGNGYTICEEMLKRMNEELARKPNGPVCAFDVLQSIPGVMPPPWTRLDLNLEKALFKQFLMAELMSKQDRNKEIASLVSANDGLLELSWEISLQRGSLFYRWDAATPAPEKTDVELFEVFRTESDKCTESRSYLYPYDLKVPRFDWAFSRWGRIPFVYKGHIYRMGQNMQRIAGVIVAISDQVEVEKNPEAETQRPTQGDICHIQLF